MANKKSALVSLLLVAGFILSGCSPVEEQKELPPNQITTIEEALEALNGGESQSNESSDNLSSLNPEVNLDNQAKQPQKTLVPSNPTIEDYINFADFTDTAAQLFLSTDPRSVNKTQLSELCSQGNLNEGSNVLGCFVTPPSRIYIYDIPDDRLLDAEAVIAAHEMLHAAWYIDLNRQERNDLTVILKTYYDSLPLDHFLRARLSLYSDSPESEPTELHSILGTEANILPAILENHYSKYFNDRRKVVNLANNSFRYLDSLRLQMSSTVESLNLEKQRVEARRIELGTANETLNRDIETFNERVSSNYYTSQIEYNKDKDALDARQSTLGAEFEAYSLETDAYNLRIKEYNTLVALVNELNSALSAS